MCGIAGILYRDAARPVERCALKGMADAIAHRGPDAEGFWIGNGPGVGLAHRRLSIIDLVGGQQPLANEDGSVQVVFNGEIYNYRELRDGLLARGHTLRTSSDTEVLVHLYEEMGPALVEKLRGMFAFALWDCRERRLVLARDRVGIKPLYVYRDAEKLLFGSELKAILAHPQVERSVDPEALEDYLALGFVAGEKSIFRRMQKLPAAHVMVMSARHWEARPQRYWELRFGADEGPSEGDWQDAIRAKVGETVERHLIADVPVGAFLSGGLDSSVVVSEAVGRMSSTVPVELKTEKCANRPHPNPLPEGEGMATAHRRVPATLQTFSMGFREAEFSELPFAHQVARQYGTRHTEEVVTPDAAQLVDELAFYFDEPFADSSAVPTLLVSRLARQSVKVALSGDGGDEAFGGYARYAHDLKEAAAREHLPGWLRRGAIGPLASAWPKTDWLPRPLRAKTRLTNLALEADAAYANTVLMCRLPERRKLLAADVAAELNGHRPEELIRVAFNRGWSGEPGGQAALTLTLSQGERARVPPSRRDVLVGMLAADTAVLLTDDFLTKVDRASMACGLEVRPPFVDHELLELAATIPSRLKVRGGETKWIMKKAFSDRLPGDAVWRAKHGFEIPVDSWLREPLRDTFESSVLAPGAPVAELVDQRAVGRLYRAHLAKVGRHGAVLWSMLILAKWAERWL
ncbi:MAG TPA: asparagine synthase (glutamine-hydrolyzing) [Pirellulales bacterium]|nr:asparagine synthase (glutamine-hydrolyzing) [Pirellulales bacterium]